MSEHLIKSILVDLQIQICDDVEKLLEPYKQDYNEYSNKLFKILLSADLSKIIRKGSLPLDIHSMHKTNLKGIHLLQLLEAEDVSKAKSRNRFYFSSDLSNMNGVSITSPSKNRMMQLIFTDGINVCSAMEFRYMPELDDFIRFWCEYRKAAENDQVSANNSTSAHILVLLSGEPEIKRGVILLLPGMLTFIMHKDAEQIVNYQMEGFSEHAMKAPKGGSNSSILSDNPIKKPIKSIQGNLDIRTYSNFLISNSHSKENSKVISSQKVQNEEDSDSLSNSYKEDELLLNKLEIKDKCHNELDCSDSDSSSVIEIVTKRNEDMENQILNTDFVNDLHDFEYFEDFDCYDDNGIREYLEHQDENFDETNSCFSRTNDNNELNIPPDYSSIIKDNSEFVQGLENPQNELVIWVEAVVLNSRRSQNCEELLLELGIDYPALLPEPWDELLLEDVCLKKQVAERILSIEDSQESSKYPNPDLKMDNLLLYVRFIQGNMCLNVSLDPNNKDFKKVNLIGFVPL